MKKQTTENISHKILEFLSYELVSLKSRYPEKTVDDILKTQGTSLFNWYDIIRNLLNGIYPDNKSISCQQEDIENNKNYGGKEWLNPKFQDKKIEDVLVFKFERLYPEVIWNLYYKGGIKFNNNRIGELFGDLLNINKQDISSFVEKSKNIKEAFSYCSEVEINLYIIKIINYFYGVLSRKNSLFYCNNFNMVPKYCINLLDIIIEKFKDNIIYVNTDMIYFRYTNELNLEKFKQILDISELPYDFLNGQEKLGKVFNQYGGRTFPSYCNYNSLYDGIFSPYRKYLLFDKDGKLIKMCGYATYKDKLDEDRLKMKINRNYKNYSG
jgi:hypothetical protein